jgi:hypothetical protein
LIGCMPRGSNSLTSSDVPKPRQPEPVGWRGVPIGNDKFSSRLRRRCCRERWPRSEIPQGRTTVIVRGAPYRPVARNVPRLTYLGPLIPIDTNAERAGRILGRIQQRCPELTPGDLMLVARMINESQRVNGPKARRRGRKTGPSVAGSCAQDLI